MRGVLMNAAVSSNAAGKRRRVCSCCGWWLGPGCKRLALFESRYTKGHAIARLARK